MEVFKDGIQQVLCRIAHATTPNMLLGHLAHQAAAAVAAAIFLVCFSGFATDRSKKYIKTIRNHIKIDAVDPQAAADKPPSTPR